ncbi:ribonuclease HII, partial [Alphaproteobacteria bacterium]|nr:ribonuclease HII [Alphaproteobacteria bacterium]
LAGPVVVACVLFKNYQNIPHGITDSKLVNKKNRVLLYKKIKSLARVGVGVVHSNIIDRLGINKATNIAADISLNKISILSNKILIDGYIKVKSELNVINIIKGDRNYVSIAAASIIAKVIRDQLMHAYSKKYQSYSWSSNMGYGTKDHLLAIKKYGITSIHRKTYKIKVLENI